MFKLYILRWGNHGYHMVGPFENKDDLEAWACDPKNNPNDDPRWNSIELAFPTAEPILYTPHEASSLVEKLMEPELGIRPLDYVS